MNIECVQVGPLPTNCYLVEDADELLVVDPGAEPDRIVEAIGERKVVGIVITHRHWDHINGITGVVAATHAPVMASAIDAPGIEQPDPTDPFDDSLGYPKVDRLLHEGDTIQVGNATFTALETPGHSQGSLCFYCEEEHVLLAGDTLFAGGSFGRTDFEGGSFEQMRRSCMRLRELPDETVVLSGHGPHSEMGREKKLNPLMRM